MKKIISLFLILSLTILWGCKNQNDTTADLANVQSAVDRTNSENPLSGEYVLEITFGEGSVLYYAKGDILWDRENFQAYGSFDQTYLGASAKLENYYSNGTMISVESGNAVEAQRTPDDVFSKFPYFKLPAAEGEVIKGTNTLGDSYKFSINDTKSLSNLIVGEDIYSLVTVLKKPQKDKTEYSQAQCIYTVKDDKVISAKYEFDVKLFDTPAYNPNYSQPESEYTLTIHVSAKVSYDFSQENIAIPQYSDESSENSK